MNNILIGFNLGSLFMIILYNLQWYMNNKKIAYLYYSILQFFMILLVIQSQKIFYFGTTLFITNAALVVVFAL